MGPSLSVRSIYRLTLALVILLTLDFWFVNAGASKPNFLLVHLDDVGYGDFSLYSEVISKLQIASNKTKISKTPQIDAIAKEGIAFSSYYASACVCTPSRAGILTGRYPIRTTVFPGVLGPDDDRGLPPQEITIARWLKEKADYRTFMVGKWHLGHMEPFLPTNHGFDRWTGMPYSHDFCACPSSLTNTADNQCRSWDPPCPIMNGTLIVEQPAILDKIVDYYVAATIESIDEALRLQKPFFGYYACHHTHHPQFAKKSNIGKSAELGGRPDAYGDAVWEMDDAIGRIVEYIRKRDIEDKTFVFITSDNGAANIYGEFSGSNAPLRCGKGTTWEGGQRVPLVVWGGGTRKGKILNDIVAGMDIFPTISVLAGISVESHPRVLDGFDFSPILTRDAFPPGSKRRESFLYYSLEGSLDAVRVGKFKVHFKTTAWMHSSCAPSNVRLGYQFEPLVYNLEKDIEEGNFLPLLHIEREKQIKLANSIIKAHNCAHKNLWTTCDVSMPVTCYHGGLAKTLFPPSTPFEPWTQTKRACCPQGLDKVVANPSNPSDFSCMKFSGDLKSCSSALSPLLCNPTVVTHPQCHGRAICGKFNQSDSLDVCGLPNVVPHPHARYCDEGLNVLRCPIGTWQCLKRHAKGDVNCAVAPKFCDSEGGVVYASRACGSCSSSLVQDTDDERSEDSKFVARKPYWEDIEPSEDRSSGGGDSEGGVKRDDSVEGNNRVFLLVFSLASVGLCFIVLARRVLCARLVDLAKSRGTFRRSVINEGETDALKIDSAEQVPSASSA